METLKILLSKMNLEVKKIDLFPDSHSSVVKKLTLTNGGIVVLKIAYNKTKFLREKKALQLLENKINCPHIIDTFEDDSKAIYALLLSFIPAAPIVNSLSQKTAFQTGELLAKFHQVKFDFIGEIFLAHHSKQSWVQYFEKLIANYIQPIQKNLPVKMIDFSYHHFIENKRFFIDELNICLCHFDFRLGNILAAKNELFLLDFESARSANYKMDFTRIEKDFAAINNNYLTAFREGYNTITTLSASHQEKVELLQFYQALGSMAWGARRNQLDDFYQENYDFAKKYCDKYC